MKFPAVFLGFGLFPDSVLAGGKPGSLPKYFVKGFRLLITAGKGDTCNGELGHGQKMCSFRHAEIL